MSAKQPTTTFEGDVVINGNLTVNGTITVRDRVTCYDLRAVAGQIRFGKDDSPDTQDLWLHLVHDCGSGKQSAMALRPAGKKNGALFLLICGDELPNGSIPSEVMLYGPLWFGNPRRQRLTLAVVRQSDGSSYAVLDSTLSGTGDPQGKREMDVQFNYGTNITATMSQKGFVITPKEEAGDVEAEHRPHD